jgi:two-component system CheB/CheR fusion protein
VSKTVPTERDDFPVVGIGASAGGLEAFTKLFTALPANSGMAFILIQHLDPTHESMMAALLSSHTAMEVLQATDGMKIERDHVYVIPPRVYLSIQKGSLHLTAPRERHGARMPLDFFLVPGGRIWRARRLRDPCRGPAPMEVLTESGQEKGGLVIVQDPKEATYDGMPRNAIKTGDADFILPSRRFPAPSRNTREAPRSKANAAAPDLRPPLKRNWTRSSISCAPRRRTILPSTSRARCCDGWSGG